MLLRNGKRIPVNASKMLSKISVRNVEGVPQLHLLGRNLDHILKVKKALYLSRSGRRQLVQSKKRAKENCVQQTPINQQREENRLVEKDVLARNHRLMMRTSFRQQRRLTLWKFLQIPSLLRAFDPGQSQDGGNLAQNRLKAPERNFALESIELLSVL